jgi:hypothetical protein
VADQNKISGVLTQAQVDAEATYAAASSINPYQAALIKKNAQGNIMSPGVLESLSALGVDAKTGVGASIANIDAQTRETRLADQKAIAQERETKNFDNSGKGIFWRGVKGLVKGATVGLGNTFSMFNATARTGGAELVRAAQSFASASAGLPTIQQAPVPYAFEQTVAGQVVLKSIEDVKKGKFPDIQLGDGFFPSEETGLGHVARQASLGAAKIAVRNSKGKVIGYRPRTILRDT